MQEKDNPILYLQKVVDYPIADIIDNPQSNEPTIYKLPNNTSASSINLLQHLVGNIK